MTTYSVICRCGKEIKYEEKPAWFDALLLRDTNLLLGLCRMCRYLIDAGHVAGGTGGMGKVYRDKLIERWT